MITPSYSLTSTERVLPKLALDFTTAILDARVTFTRTGDTATVTNSSGVIAAINADLPRFDFDPTTLVCKGLLIEEARTNSLLNSLLDGTDLATQTVVVTAAARTLSFYGNGTIVLSGAHSATVVGVGAYPTRTTLTFTPSAGSLILTVTGTVQFAQLETGAFATSFIPTDGTTKTRNADIATMTGTNFSDWHNASEGTFKAICQTVSFVGSKGIFAAGDNTKNFANANVIYSAYLNTSGNVNDSVINGGASQASLTPTKAQTINTVTKNVISYKANSFAASTDASTVATDNAGTIPTVVGLSLGNLTQGWSGATNYLNGYLVGFYYWPQRLTNSEVQAFSK